MLKKNFFWIFCKQVLQTWIPVIITSFSRVYSLIYFPEIVQGSDKFSSLVAIQEITKFSGCGFDLNNRIKVPYFFVKFLR
jgi:hypothetical protein